MYNKCVSDHDQVRTLSLSLMSLFYFESLYSSLLIFDMFFSEHKIDDESFTKFYKVVKRICDYRNLINHPEIRMEPCDTPDQITICNAMLTIIEFFGAIGRHEIDVSAMPDEDAYEYNEYIHSINSMDLLPYCLVLYRNYIRFMYGNGINRDDFSVIKFALTEYVDGHLLKPPLTMHVFNRMAPPSSVLLSSVLLTPVLPFSFDSVPSKFREQLRAMVPEHDECIVKYDSCDLSKLPALYELCKSCEPTEPGDMNELCDPYDM
jgi:hypothetical protein